MSPCAELTLLGVCLRSIGDAEMRWWVSDDGQVYRSGAEPGAAPEEGEVWPWRSGRRLHIVWRELMPLDAYAREVSWAALVVAQSKNEAEGARRDGVEAALRRQWRVSTEFRPWMAGQSAAETKRAALALSREQMGSIVAALKFAVGKR